MQKLFLILGLLGLTTGLFWMGQGLGYIAYPHNSFMIKQIHWAYYGGELAFVGLLLLWFSRA